MAARQISTIYTALMGSAEEMGKHAIRESRGRQ
jgi:hypothetical protein